MRLAVHNYLIHISRQKPHGYSLVSGNSTNIYKAHEPPPTRGDGQMRCALAGMT